MMFHCFDPRVAGPPLGTTGSETLLCRYNEPSALPGLEENLVYEGWDPEFAWFSYVLNRYTTTFGVGTSAGASFVAELYYSVGLKRNFLNPLLDHALPLGVIALLLFIALSLTTSDEARLERLGSSTLESLTFYGALLFAVILSHNAIRASISPAQIAYLEVFPFVLYAVILLVALNALLLAGSSPPRLIAYRDNQLPRLLYWPLVMGLLLVIRLVTLGI